MLAQLRRNVLYFFIDLAKSDVTYYSECLMSDLYKAFHEYFEIVIADTPCLKEKVFRMRYQKLCIDMNVPGYEPSLYPDGQEKDDYDDHSSHILIRYRQTGEFIGTARLIMFDYKNPDKLFPIEQHTRIDSSLFNVDAFSRRHIGEISRFLIVNKFERRRSERRNYRTREAIVDIAKAKDRRSINNLTLVLMAGIVRVSAQYNINIWFTIMEPALNRLLNYYGLGLNPIGPAIQHYGLRQPYFGELSNIVSKMRQDYRGAWEVVTEHGKYSRFLSVENTTGMARTSD